MRRGREAVQQDELGVARLASFAEKDVEPFDREGSHPYHGTCEIGSIVHLTLLRCCPRQVGLLGEEPGCGGRSAGTTTHQVHLVSYGDLASFEHETVERELAVETPVD